MAQERRSGLRDTSTLTKRRLQSAFWGDSGTSSLPITGRLTKVAIAMEFGV